MLTKNKVKKTLDSLPYNFTVDQIVEKLVILNRIEEGRVFSTGQVKQELHPGL